MTFEINRRRFSNSVIADIVGTQLPGTAIAESTSSQSAGNTHRLPYGGIRVIELSTTLSGRLAGLLFADQGAEVVVAREAGFKPGEHDEFLDRNKASDKRKS